MNPEQERIVKEVHNFVKEESAKSLINDGISDIFKFHILNVVKFSKLLADEYKANKFVAVLASYLHDITYIQTADHETHELTGAEFVKGYLSKFNISVEEIEMISKCVLNHRGSKNSLKESIEEKIVACSDAMDHIDRCLSMLYRSGDRNFEEAFKFMQGKIKRGWKKIELEKAREIIRPKFEAAKILFEID